MTKSPDAFKTISEVADELKLPQHVLRFWETRFSQIKPMKRGGGRRYYRPDDLSLLRGIRHLLYSEGYTIKGVQRILKEQGARHVATQWLDAGDQQTVAQPNEVAAVAPQAPVEPAASIPVPPTAVMQPIGHVAEPVVVCCSFGSGLGACSSCACGTCRCTPSSTCRTTSASASVPNCSTSSRSITGRGITASAC